MRYSVQTYYRAPRGRIEAESLEEAVRRYETHRAAEGRLYILREAPNHPHASAVFLDEEGSEVGRFHEIGRITRATDGRDWIAELHDCYLPPDFLRFDDAGRLIGGKIGTRQWFDKLYPEARRVLKAAFGGLVDDDPDGEAVRDLLNGRKIDQPYTVERPYGLAPTLGVGKAEIWGDAVSFIR